MPKPVGCGRVWMARGCLIGVLLLSLATLGSSYPNGAPLSACRDFLPQHGVLPRNEPSPFVILLSKASYRANETLMVMLRGLCSTQFRGFLVQARRADPKLDTEELLGTFTAVRGSNYTCNEKSLTHNSNIVKMSLLFNWTAPATSVGHVIFRAAFVYNKTTIWHNVTSAVVDDPTAPELSVPSQSLLSPYIPPCPEDLPSTTTSDPFSSQFTTVGPPGNNALNPPPDGKFEIDTQCGSTQGCFRQCPDDRCHFQVAWRDLGDKVWFQLKGTGLTDSGEKWLALGLSKDQKMGDDSVVECIQTAGRTVIHLSYNDKYGNNRIDLGGKNVVNLGRSGSSDGSLTCEFTRAKVVSGQEQVFDLDQEWYLLMAQGSAKEGSKLQHTGTPYVSAQMVDFQKIFVVEPSQRDTVFIKVHGCLMAFVWMFCASIGIVAARFYKPLWPTTKICGRKVWFTVHRTCMMSLFIINLTAFILVFVEVGGFSEVNVIDFKRLHPILGVIVTALTFINVIMALFRPSSTSRNRPVYNWAHWGIGIMVHVVAVVNIMLGVQLSKAGVHDYIKYILWTFAGYQAIVILVLELISCNSRVKEKKMQSYMIYARRNTIYASAKDIDEEEDVVEPPGSFTLRIILRVHVLVITALTAAVVAIIALNE